MFGYCNNERDQREDGRNDFERQGHYDNERYNDPFSDCSKYYTQGYDDARRDEDRRQEYREEERQEEERQQQRHQDQQEMQRQEEENDYDLYLQEQDYYNRQEQQYREQEQNGEDDLPF